MNWHRINRLGLVVAVAALVAAACGGTTPTTSANWKTAASLSAGGGMDALVAAAKAEGQLNIIATPPDWANYGASIEAFKAKYGIKVNSANPAGGSQDEIDAVNNLAGTSSAPDVLDVGLKYALANTALFTPYKVQTWDDIPAAQKEATGLWWQDYGGFMGIGYDPSKVPGGINSVADLLGPNFRSKVALAGDPLKSNQAVNGILMASLANGGSADDVSKGVDWFHQLKVAGNYVPVIATAATIKAGQTPVVFEWDYLSSSHGKDVAGWKIFEPSNAVLGNYYTQAINKGAPHPAAVRLWEEFLFSNDGQNNWLKGGARPVRMDAMQTAGTLDATAAAALPKVSGTPVFPTAAQQTAAGAYISAHWKAAVG
ncbi:MAG: ABC transporter substrate-binding protein [Candidatus Dormiibacterota bacterium]